MTDLKRRLFFTFLTLGISASCATADQPGSRSAQCPPAKGIALQVLGSGGPIADDGRASSAYLVWLDGRARLMVDAGGGSFLRFGEVGAKFRDLELVALSHFHTDHSGDLPELLKTGYFSDREKPLRVSGPTGNNRFPGLQDYLAGLLDPDSGPYRYLSGYLDGGDGLVRIDATEVNHRNREPAVVLDVDELRVSALGVPHGIVPTLAYRIEAGGKTIVFGSDQKGSSNVFRQFAQGADYLVSHMAIPENAGRAARSLHATPSMIGEMAAESGVKNLLLSHFMARSLRNMDQNLTTIAKNYTGKVLLAEDLVCLIP